MVRTVETYLYDDTWLIIYHSGQEGKLFVGWEDAYGSCGADLLTEEEMFKKYPWIKDTSYQEELDKLK